MYNFSSCQNFPYLMPQELCKLVCIPWTTNNAGSFQHEKYASKYWFLGWKFSLQHLVYLRLTPSVQYKPYACRPPKPNSNKSSMVKPPPLPPPPLFFFLKYRFFHRLEGKNTFFIGFKRKPLFQSVLNTNHFFYR